MMNKQEIIDRLEYNQHPLASIREEIEWNNALDLAIDIIKEELDESEKPVVPQFVADWYEDNKNDFEWEVYQLCVEYHKHELEGEIRNWFGSMDNKPIETLVLMHKFGYEVEKEKLYTVKLKLSGEYLNSEKENNRYMMGSTTKNFVKELKSYCYTQTELEELGVWDNSAFEIVEVK